MNNLNTLKNKLKDKKALIGILGLGYVGLPLMLRYVEAGYKVLGFDNDSGRISKLKTGQTYIRHISSERISGLKSGFDITADLSRAFDCDALILCLPTPLDEHRAPDLSIVINTFDSVLHYLRKGQIVSLESTTWPGTTEEVLLPRIESTGMRIGKDLALVFSPEREDPGNSSFTTRTIPKVIGGITHSCLEAGLCLYDQVIDKMVPVSSTQAAELTKLLENIHRAVNIGLVNEMKIVADKMGIVIHEVIRAASTKPFGFVPYSPGPGIGGHCIPIDPFYLTWKAKEFGITTRFIELAGEINRNMPEWVVSKVEEGLNDRKKSIKGSSILILGIAYKKNIDDIRQSPAIRIIKLLEAKGGRIGYSDPYIPIFPIISEHHSDLTSVVVSSSSIASYDCVIVATNHDDFDYELIQKSADLIVDTRGVYLEKTTNVISA